MSAQKERMDQGFSVFNCHVNNASDRADAEFIEQFGQAAFDRNIKPLHEHGIMAIFHFKNPNIYKVAWVTLVTAFVNENRKSVAA